MATAFSTSQAQRARYGYERLVYTGWPFAGSGGASMLAAGPTPLFSAARWNTRGGPTKQARIEMLQSTRNGGVSLLWSADPQNQINAGQSGATMAMPDGNRQVEQVIQGVDTLSLQIVNNSGGTIAGWQTNYAIGVRRLTATDKLLAQRAGYTNPAYELTPAEAEALRRLDLAREIKGQLVVDKTGLDQMRELVAKGTQPLSLSRIMAGIYDNRLQQAPADLWAPTSSDTDNPFAQYDAQWDPAYPAEGHIQVLTEIAFEPASAPPNVLLSVDRDGDISHLQVYGAAFTQADEAPWRVWLPATQYLTFHVINGPGGGGSTTTVPVRLKVLSLEMSEVLAVQMGLVDHPGDVAPATYYKAIAGVV